MTDGARDVHIHSSPAVAANAEGDEIEVLESTDVLPVAPEDQWKSLFDKVSRESDDSGRLVPASRRGDGEASRFPPRPPSRLGEGRGRTSRPASFRALFK
ncbi:hypothetical protein COCON_G00025470 [Conger conger]|uniref:Uncharacterized protein n=1 Tax=Conger conger TaxID=82655 RepID=A0A9Q1DXT3_CONCO|nr:hypothetical protein COCON_G00025470 [Conger conger]